MPVLTASEGINERPTKIDTGRTGVESLFREFVECAPDAIVVVNEAGAIVLINRQAEAMFATARGELYGQPIESLVPKALRLRHREHRNRYFQSPTLRPMGTALDLCGVRADGTEFPVEVSLSPIDAEGQQLVVAAVRDITHRKHVEAKLEEQHDRLLHAERLAAIGEMVAGMAHESRNALQRSQASLGLLKHLVAEQPELQRLVQQIQDSQDFLHQLYEQVRQYAAPIRLELGTARLDWIAKETWFTLNANRDGRWAAFEQRVNGCDLKCRIDQFRFGQVMRNLFENSLNACNEDLHISIDWSEVQYNGQPALQAVYRDDGPGLNAEQRARVFDAFFTTRTRGTGLGMAIAKRMLEAHGGTICVGATNANGAEFVITIPRRHSEES